MVKPFKIGGKFVGEGNPVFIVAEIGQNHNGSMEIAKKLIDQATNDGVDAVKFCKRDIDSELTKAMCHSPYLGRNSFGETYGKHREFLELSIEQHMELKEYARLKNLIYFASVCDKKSVDEMGDLGVPMFKIASRDLTNKPLIEHVAKKHLPIFLSTGMSGLEEIRRTIDLIRGYHDEILLFHCTSEYPTQYKNVHLNVLPELKKEFNLNIGMSDHVPGIMVACAAAVKGAVAVEKHITLSRDMKGTDHPGALDPPGMERLVTWIRNFEKAKGSRVKAMCGDVFISKKKLSRSIVASRNLNRGERITQKMVNSKTHTSLGLNPFEDEKIIGKILNKDIEEDNLILLEDVE